LCSVQKGEKEKLYLRYHSIKSMFYLNKGSFATKCW
jgi:hypothetical protein